MVAIKDKIVGYIAIGRLQYMLIQLLLAAAIVVLIGAIPSLEIQAIGWIALLLGLSGLCALNDFFDREADEIRGPNRPIPSGRVSPTGAVYFGLISVIIFLTLVWMFFNKTCFYFVTLMCIILFVQFSTKKVRYNDLLLSFGPALIALSIWTAFAELSLPAVIFATGMYFIDIAHSGPESIEDYEADKKFNLQSFAVMFGPKKTAQFVSVSLFITIILFSYLKYLMNLSYVYLVVVILSGLWCLWLSILLQKNPLPERGRGTFMWATLYRIIIFVMIIVDKLVVLKFVPGLAI